MISEIKLLWKRRERPDSLARIAAVWTKRARHAGSLFSILCAPYLLRMKGAMIGQFSIVNRVTIHGRGGRVSIGSECALGRCELHRHDDIAIGNCVVINDGALLLTASHRLDDSSWEHKRGAINVGDYAWIATNAIILPGVSIGRGAVIGAGAVVRKDVPEYCIAIGNPAVIQSTKRFSDLQYSPVRMNAPFEAWLGMPAPGTTLSPDE